MIITFDPAANADLDRIFAWISKDNKRAAYGMIQRIEARIALLAIPGLAYMGRVGRDEGTHELVEAPSSSCTRFTRSVTRSSCFPFSTAHKTARIGKAGNNARTNGCS